MLTENVVGMKEGDRIFDGWNQVFFKPEAEFFKILQLT